MALALPDAISDEEKRANAAGLKHRLINSLAERLAARAKACRAILGAKKVLMVSNATLEAAAESHLLTVAS